MILMLSNFLIFPFSVFIDIILVKSHTSVATNLFSNEKSFVDVKDPYNY